MLLLRPDFLKVYILKDRLQIEDALGHNKKLCIQLIPKPI